MLSSLPSLYPLSLPKPIMPAGFIHLKPIFHVVYMGDTQMVSSATEKNKAVKGESIREGAAGLKKPQQDPEMTRTATKLSARKTPRQGKK